MIGQLWGRFSDWICHVGTPLVYVYQLVCADPFLSTQVEDAKGLEYVANQVLIPVHYLLAGRTATPVKITSEDGSIVLHYEFKQKFQYQDSYFWAKTVSSFAALPISLPLGVVLKGLAHVSPEVRSHYAAIRASDASRYVASKIDYYKSVGIPIGNYAEAAFIDPPKHVRAAGEEKHLEPEKNALKEIFRIFEENNILSWVDCGTCLGAYRYGGVIPWDWDVDLSILEVDHDNAKRALNALDPNKYVVQEWSGRSAPNTYLRVYVKETGAEIDLYHFRINPETKTVNSVLSYDQNIFMIEGWKMNERRHTHQMAYEWIFPLKKANFDGIVVPVPNQIETFLKSKYGENISPSKIFNVATGKWEKDPTHPYWQRLHAK